ncbi:DUF1294 domain-containing protein [Aquabacterium sp. A7-Y]|uniref:DUF1294 domain-containing protein n=1 Tax=Aquabacterium sp. A7-Y TaxID=1349605 RepID=UPI00223DCD70|nr:DUF1294 domain-containing protein [Aquabacterium sp. A7-Y]MCW7540400.1 DUF1294 domain-containing protein [Aquabacterium sp. A7-Y]
MSGIAMLVFLGIYLAVALMWSVPTWLTAAYLAASLVCFVTYALDKRAAQAGCRRVPERTLHVMGLAGGWPGALLAQQWLRHKSSKVSFRTRFWATVVLNVSAFVLLNSPWMAGLAG